MMCLRLNCWECVKKDTYAVVLKTISCSSIPPTDCRILETDRVSFEQFLQLRVSPLIDRGEKNWLQYYFPEDVEKLKTL